MPLQISSAAQHNLSESYRRYIELKRMPPAELPQEGGPALIEGVAAPTSSVPDSRVGASLKIDSAADSLAAYM